MTYDNIPNICACMGPQGGDPVCPCRMRAQGLQPSNQWTEEDKERLGYALSQMYGWEKPKDVNSILEE
jgi:hypothetical protein